MTRVYETQRLRLRPHRPDDLEPMLAYRSRADVARWLYHPPQTEADIRDLLERRIAEGRPAFAAELRETGELVGDVSIRVVSDEHRQGEIGFIFDPAHQGRGYATEAARVLLGIGFGELDLHRIVGRLEARNDASARVLAKLGMRREAHLLENEWVKGEWQSEVIYAMLAAEWAAGRA